MNKQTCKRVLSPLKYLGCKSLVLTAICCLFLCCSKDSGDAYNILKITNFSLPEKVTVAIGDEIVIQGRGFEEGDFILLNCAGIESQQYCVEAAHVTPSSLAIVIPGNMKDGKYEVYVIRDSQRQMLGHLTIHIIANIPNCPGMNIKGLISCDGNPLANVVVSDGYQVVRTDQNGIYYLNSDKKNGYVFISLPGGYEVEKEGVTPQFFQYLNRPAAEVEQHNFSLRKRSNESYKLLVFTDVHLADRVSDLKQFRNGFMAHS